ncbi:MAG TPA: hypothetical protein VG870_12075 [Chitinophagaceae bacterium]|nr:hypothetical protein [Chitinophagaceae bacterium]
MATEFMLYIRNAGDAKASLSAADHLAFVRACEAYIGRLKAGYHLIAAQPLGREGYVLSRSGQGWHHRPLDLSSEVQVGYYHILARDMEEALKIARQNPEFAYVPSATIEVRPVKRQEEETRFIYPR